MKPIVALAGGIGAARFLEGLARVVDPERMFIIGNTADDAEFHGLHVSPDLDTVMYTLAGLADPARGWGIRGDTFRCLEALGRLGADTWFQLGDRDIATHLFRSYALRQGQTLCRVTAALTDALGVRSQIVPMSNEPIRSRIRTPRGELEFQTYFVRRRARDRVLGVCYAGVEGATPAPGILAAIANSAAIVVCPSNPFISIGPILAVPGIREALRRARARVAVISPIVGGRALKGPAARMMRSMKLRPSAVQVAKLYADFTGIFVLDTIDATQAPRVNALGIRPVVTDTIMRGLRERKALARVVAGELGIGS